MGLIKKSAELVIPTNVKMMIYGQAGMGKTTIALSSPKPLLIDFDNGVKRVNESHLQGVDIVQVESWEDIRTLLIAELSSLNAYKSIVVDTIGKMMDYIINYKCANRQPSIRDWSGINQEFQWFVRAISSLNKNIVFVAHRDTRKEGDDTVFIPALREKSYNSIVTELDLLGYMEMRNQNGIVRRTITFDPTNRSDGKNTCNMPAIMEIPTIVDKQGHAKGENNFIQNSVIAPYISMLGEKKKEQEAYNKIIGEIEDNIALITDAQSANDFLSRIGNFEHVGSSKEKAAYMMKKKADELGLVFDKKTKQYADNAA